MNFLSLHERKKNRTTELTNTISIEADKAMPILSKSTVIVQASADLMITQTLNKPKVYVDENLIYIITILNNGPSDATNVILTDIFPLDFKLISINPFQGNSSYSNGTIKYNLGNIAKYSKSIITITFKSKVPGVFKNFASIVGNEFDPNINNNSSTETVIVNPLEPRYRGFDFF